MVRKVIDIEPYEIEAMSYAGRMMGEYLEEIKQSDIANLNGLQWNTMLSVVCLSFLQKRAELSPCPF